MFKIDQHLSALHTDGQAAGGLGLPLVPARRKFSKDQRGAMGIIFGVMLFVLFGFMGFALDLSLLYNRKVELQALADAAAIAAASQLVGTNAGVLKALDAAATEATNFKYQYRKRSVTWSDTAIKFSSSTALDAIWLDSSSAKAAPQGLLFAKVDTSALNAAYGTVDTIFMRILPDGATTSVIRATAIAGRSSLNVVPLAICALSPIKANQRGNTGPPPNVELEEYGFRRGVSYDLMNLNPNSTTVPGTAENFVIDPIAPLESVGSPLNTSVDVVGPFVCVGRIPKPRLTGKTIAVSRLFPIGSLFNQLNSRFDQYIGGLCKPNQAPPDTNVKAYDSAVSVPWMAPAPGILYQTAGTLTQGGHLYTIASPLSPPAGTTASMYGPLWSFAKAVPYSSYVDGVPEPANGYATFGTAAWTTLYNPLQASNSYPATTPYLAGTLPNFLAPPVNGPGIRFRRVLNVPLLSCPVDPGANVTATVLGIGRFFMTVPATNTTISAEFAGLVPEESLGGPVELVQ
jgi:Flp pilus assembly protein TadG